MIIYNVTTKVTHQIAERWVEWMKHVHIPAIKDTGCFTNAAMLHLFESDDAEGVTYAVQYYSDNLENYKMYLRDHASQMRKQAIDQWGDQFISFRSVMQVVH